MRERLSGLLAVVIAVGLCFGVLPEAAAAEPGDAFDTLARSKRSGSSSSKKRRGRKRSKARRTRKRSKRTAWHRFQLTLGTGITNQSTSAEEEGNPLNLSAFLGMPVGRYSPGLYTTLGGRLQSESCGTNCRSTGFGPAFRLGLASGSRRQISPGRMLYVEGALIFSTLDLDGPSPDGTMFPRLAVGIASPNWRRAMLNKTSHNRPLASAGWLFLSIFNHFEAFVETQGPQGQPGIRGGVMFGLGL